VSSSSRSLDAPRPAWRRRPFLFVVVLLVVFVGAVGVARDALAYTVPCSDATVWDRAVCERTEAAATAAEAIAADVALAREAAVDTRQMVGWCVGVLLVAAASPVLVRVFRGAS